ncbi:MFS transporter [Yeguia hominis]|uniref:MFS transporter n=1 Tax=Yeguia hominis TaxID=2763662 RepID=A0A926D8M2_9FIRM|nr:MFS transporter [Yeguia hominis]MBC8534430.1 MFS transporter [Yeguia hominis]
MKLNYKRTFFVGLAFLSICAFWQLYDSIIPLILKNTFQIDHTWSGVIMALDNVLALFLLPLFGTLSDKTNTRLGRRTPYILFGTIGAVIFMLLIPVADHLVRPILFFLALMATLLFMSTYRSPAVALMPDLTPKPLRSKANAVINLMGAVGSVISLALIAVLVPKSEKPDYFPIYAIVAGLMLLSVLVLVLTIREKKLAGEVAAMEALESSDEPAAESDEKMPRDVRKSLILILISVTMWYMGYNAVTTSFSKYAQDYLQIEGGGFASLMMVATVAAVLSYLPVGFLATRIGRKKTILIGVALLFVSFGAAFAFTRYHWFMIVLFILTGIGWASINVNSYPMVVEMAKGSDVGRYTGYYYAFSMAAQILTPILSGFLLQYVGYWTLFPYAVLFVTIAFCTMCGVRHGDSRPVLPKDKLEMLDVEE